MRLRVYYLRLVVVGVEERRESNKYNNFVVVVAQQQFCRAGPALTESGTEPPLWYLCLSSLALIPESL